MSPPQTLLPLCKSFISHGQIPTRCGKHDSLSRARRWCGAFGTQGCQQSGVHWIYCDWPEDYGSCGKEQFEKGSFYMPLPRGNRHQGNALKVRQIDIAGARREVPAPYLRVRGPRPGSQLGVSRHPLQHRPRLHCWVPSVRAGFHL